jgi:hypothetical protein
LRETVRTKEAAEAGDGGGGMETALGILCFGVSKGVRLFVGVVDCRPTPMPELRPPMPGFGVLREGEPVVGNVGPVSEMSSLYRVGLPAAGYRVADGLVGLVGSRA